MSHIRGKHIVAFSLTVVLTILTAALVHAHNAQPWFLAALAGGIVATVCAACAITVDIHSQEIADSEARAMKMIRSCHKKTRQMIREEIRAGLMKAAADAVDSYQARTLARTIDGLDARAAVTPLRRP